MKRGPKPVSLTLAHKWLMDKGVSVAEFAARAGVHFTLAHRHLSGRGPVSKRIYAEYVRAYPDFGWKPGALQAIKTPKQLKNKTLTPKPSRGRIWA